MAVGKPRSVRERRPVADAGKHIATSGPPALGEDAQAAGPQRPSLIPAAVVFGLWDAALIGMAVFTANPITLNYAQITSAPLIVQGTFERSAADERGFIELRVQNTWPAGREGETIVIDADPRLRVTAGQSYLVPLAPLDGHYRIVPTRVPSAAPAVYPANPQTLAQLDAILSRE